MRPLWTYEALEHAMAGRPFGGTPATISGISIDSRTVGPGEAFFAIQGERFDGHDFVTMALARGAATAVVSEDKLAALGRVTGSLTVVRDVLDGLRALGIAARVRTLAKIAAITGSVGKTSTKEMLAAALRPSGAVHYSPASFNNHWGVPLTLARMPQDSAFGVFEIGMNHAGEIEPLTKMVRPHVAIVTTVEPVHLEFFDSVESIARAKAEIFLGLEPGGAAVLNRDNPHFALLAEAARVAGAAHIVSFGAHEAADARLVDLTLEDRASQVRAHLFGKDIAYTVGAPGRHLVQNSLAVLTAVSLLGGDLHAAAEALGGIAAGKGRGQQTILDVPGGHATLIDESYNANPASMRAAIALLASTAPTASGRRIAVLGDMRELGPESEAMHAGLAEDLVAAGVDSVYAVGPMMAALAKALPVELATAHAEKAADIEDQLAAALAPGDVVMVKGSNASRMGPLVETIKARFAPATAAPKPTQEQETA